MGEGPAGLLRLGGGLDLLLGFWRSGFGAMLAPAAFPALGFIGRRFGGRSLLGFLGLLRFLRRFLGGFFGGCLLAGGVLFAGGLTGFRVFGVHQTALAVLLRGLEDLHGVVVLPAGDGLFQQLLNVFEHGQLAVIAEGDGRAPLPCAARPADPMDIGFGDLGEVVVEDIGQVLDVQATGSDVRGDQDPQLPRLELPQALLPGGLGLVAVDGGGGDALAGQVPGHFVRAVLGAGEDQGAAHVLLL